MHLEEIAHLEEVVCENAETDYFPVSNLAFSIFEIFGRGFSLANNRKAGTCCFEGDEPFFASPNVSLSFGHISQPHISHYTSFPGFSHTKEVVSAMALEVVTKIRVTGNMV